jgi:tetratricopeptide (TPR) repeat protein
MISKRMKTLLACGIAAALIAGCGGKEERKATYLERGKTFMEEQNFEKARVEFRNVLQIDPKTAEAYYFMGRLDEEAQEWGKAFRNYDKAVELDPSLVAARVRLGQFYSLQAGAENSRGNTEDEAEAIRLAFEQIEEVLKLDPGNLDVLVIKAGIEAQENMGNSISALKDVIRKDPAKDDAYMLLARLQEINGQLDDARDTIDQGIAARPDNMPLRMRQVQFFARLEDTAAAVSALREMIRLKPEELSYRISLAAYFVQSGEIDQAEAVLREAITVDPSDPNRYLSLAQFIYTQRGGDAAIKEMEAFISQNPRMYELHFGLESLYRQAGDVAKAKAVLESVVQAERTEPQGLRARTRQADIYAAEGEFSEAGRLADEVLAINPKDYQALLIKGKLAMQEGNLDAAVSSFRSILRDQPDAVPVMQLLAQTHLNKGEADLAGDQLQRAVQIAPDNVDARLGYARYLLARNDLEGATRQMEAALNVDPASIQVLGTQSDLLFATQDTTGHQDILEKMKAAMPDSAEPNLRMARLLLSSGDAQGALREADAALAKGANNFRGLVIKSDILASLQDVEGLRAVLSAMQEHYPESPDGYFRMGRLHRAENKMDLALAQYEKALEVTGGRSEVLMLSEVIDFELKTGRIDEAEARLKEIISKDQQHLVANNLLGMVHLSQRRFADAAAAFEAQLAINPNSATVYSQLASARAMQKDLPGAVAALEDGLEVIPNDLSLLMMLAQVEERRENYPRAIDVYGQILRKVPNNVVANNNLAILLVDHAGDQFSIDEAKKLIMKLEDIEQPAILDTVGWVNYKAGNYTKAVQVLKSVVEQQPEQAQFHYHLGMALQKQGDAAGAKHHLARALELGDFTGSDQARAALAEL